MRSETVSSRDRAKLRARAAVAALGSGIAGVALLILPQLAGCHSGNGNKSGAEGGVSPACQTNVGNSSGDPVSLTSGQISTGMICYQNTSDWYVIDVPAGSSLLDVAAGYPAGVVTPVDLDVKVYFQTNSTTLTLVKELVATAGGDTGAAGIQTTLLATSSGSYYIQAGDQHGQAVDQTNSYSLTVGYASDPDTHEPNDTPAAAKPADGKPGWLAYLGDLDVFSTSASSASDLLTLSIVNPSAAPAAVDYTVTDSNGVNLGEGTAPPSAKTFTTALPVTAAGTFYATLSYPQGTISTRATAAGYTLSFGTTPNPDTLDNHSISTAVCPGGGGTGPCSMAYSGTPVTLPPETSFLSVTGQSDFYRIDVTSGAAALLEMDLTSSSSTPVQYALDLLVPDPNSACQTDSDCQAINTPCSSDNDCELSHTCMPAGMHKFCPTAGVACQLCEGAGLCIPAGSSGGYCAVAQFLTGFSPGKPVTGAADVSTTQPLFSDTSYYVRVHDAHYSGYDESNPYTLTLKMVPEPDPYDQSPMASQRNNFYNPYPTAMTDRTPNKARAVQLTAAQVQAGVTGYISYQTDEDWFYFPIPCEPEAGLQYCGLDFQWIQPASNVKVAIFILSPTTLLPEESFTYSGTVPPSAPVTGDLNNSDCSSCSSGQAGQTAYVQIADLHEKAWDYSPAGQYSFKIANVTPGCPAVCNGDGGTAGNCISQCAAENVCCPTLQ